MFRKLDETKKPLYQTDFEAIEFSVNNLSHQFLIV